MIALEKIKSAGFTLELDGIDLVIEPFSKLTPNQLAFLKSHKAEIIQELKGVTNRYPQQQQAGAIRIYKYRVTDKPDCELTVIMPDTEIDEARNHLASKFGNRLLDVVERKQ